MMLNLKPPRVAVEYDCRGKRERREFDCPYEARRFYTAKLKLNKNPAVKKAQEN